MERTIERAAGTAPARSTIAQVAAGRYVATGRASDAVNSAEFLARVRDEIGIELEIHLDRRRDRLVVNRLCPAAAPAFRTRSSLFPLGALDRDCGCGSDHQRSRAARYGPSRPNPRSISLPFGVVTFTRRFGGIEVSPHRSIGRWSPRRKRRWRRSKKRTESAASPRPAGLEMLGNSGTVTTLAGVHLALPRYIRAMVDGSALTSARWARRRLAPPRQARHRGARRQPTVRREARRSGPRLRHSRRGLCDLAGRPAARRRRSIREGILFDGLMQAARVSS